MFFFLSKTIPYLLMPLSLVLIGLITSLFLKNQKSRRYLRTASIALLLFCSNQVIINSVFKLWEIQPTPLFELSVNDELVGIVLTGVVRKEKLPHDRVYFADGADRVTHAIQLYKEGKIHKIIISGGTGSFSKSEIREADQLQEVFLMCEVPQEDLIVEDQSRNTRESALAVSKIVEAQFQNSELLLITSGFHMRRSLGCFRKAGMEVRAFSTDFKTGDYPPRFTSFVTPSPGAINNWHILVREWIGIAAYKFMGYM